MAKYTVKHACGCEREYSLFGKGDDRRRKLEWLETLDCPECRRKAEAEYAKEATANLELPELQGSPKQVAWANTIRGMFIASAKAQFNDEVLDKAIKLISGVTAASKFIDYRDWNCGEFLTHLLRESNTVAETLKEAPTPEPVKEEKTVKAPEWRKVAINAQNVECTTGNGAKINIPHSSDFDGYSVWVSQKLLRAGRHSYEYLLSVKDDMEFNLKKYGNGKYNKFKVIAEKSITADELAEAFGGYVESAPRYTEPAIDPDKEEIIKHEPAPLEPVEIEADPELKR